MGSDFFGRHWHHILGGGGGFWFLQHVVRRKLQWWREQRDERRFRDGLRKLKWEQQRERLRVDRWRDDIGKLD